MLTHVSSALALCAMCLLAENCTLKGVPRADDVHVNRERIERDGLVKVAQALADSKATVVLKAPSVSTQSATTEAGDSSQVSSVSKAIESELKRLGPQCAGMSRQEFEDTLKGLLKIGGELEECRTVRASVCALELRTECLRIMSARLAGSGEMPSDVSKDILVSQIMSPSASTHYRGLLEVWYPKWKDQIGAMSSPLQYADWYAVFNLGSTGDVKAWPDRKPNEALCAVVGRFGEYAGLEGRELGMCDLAVVLFINEIERLRLEWLVRTKVACGEFPKERREFDAAVKAHMRFTAKDRMPLSNIQIEYGTMWSFYHMSLVSYQQWSKEGAEIAK